MVGCAVFLAVGLRVSFATGREVGFREDRFVGFEDLFTVGDELGETGFKTGGLCRSSSFCAVAGRPLLSNPMKGRKDIKIDLIYMFQSKFEAIR